MQQVTFTLRTLTPLFLAGADQTQAELRAPTFRGLMRYWYRALVGGIVGADTGHIETVMKAETAIFGATDTGSAVTVRVSDASHAPREFTERTNINVGGIWKATGKGYLLWSMVRSGSEEKRNLKPARWFFPANTTFRITLSAHSGDEKKMRQAVAAFWLLTHLGSVGSRSRRCAGSLAIVPTTETSDFNFALPADVQELKTMLQQGIQTARTLYGTGTAQSRENATFDALTRNSCRIWILQNGQQPWSTSELAMTGIGERLQQYRGSIFPLRLRRIFGLPLKDVDNRSRRASPLLLRVTELQGNKFVGIAVLFKTVSRDTLIEDYELIETWVSGLPGSVEVTF